MISWRLVAVDELFDSTSQTGSLGTALEGVVPRKLDVKERVAQSSLAVASAVCPVAVVVEFLSGGYCHSCIAWQVQSCLNKSSAAVRGGTPQTIGPYPRPPEWLRRQLDWVEHGVYLALDLRILVLLSAQCGTGKQLQNKQLVLGRPPRHTEAFRFPEAGTAPTLLHHWSGVGAVTAALSVVTAAVQR